AVGVVSDRRAVALAGRRDLDAAVAELAPRGVDRVRARRRLRLGAEMDERLARVRVGSGEDGGAGLRRLEQVERGADARAVLVGALERDAGAVALDRLVADDLGLGLEARR